MGLSVSHGAWYGAYSAFMRFREAVIKATGGEYELNLGVATWHFELGDGYSKETHPALCEFLCHSDCDGEIAPEVAGKLADEMEPLLPALDAMGDGGGHLGKIGDAARRWIAGCRAAAAAGEPLEFG